jgi:Xaa-Pro aminopeptidase
VNRVLEVTKPGVTGADLVRVAAEREGAKPWLSYFYLAHGIGTDSAEMPLIGTDRGEKFDEQIVLEPGMVLVFEPVVWEDGYCGHRSEETIAITEDGYLWLSNRAEFDGIAS